MPDLYRFSSSFEPILLEKMTANLFGSELPPEGFPVEVKAVGALPEKIENLGVLTAATWDQDNELTDLEMGKMEMAQLRMIVLQDVQIRLKHPASVTHWRTNKTNFYLPEFPTEPGMDFLREYYFRASEFLIWQDLTPRWDAYSTLTTTTCYIKFLGWKFKMAKLPVGVRGRIDLYVDGWPGSSK